MESKLENFIKNLSCNTPASQIAITDFEKYSNFKLPKDYVEFLKETNGGEGFVGENSYVIFWPLEKLLEYNKAYNVQEYAPGLFLIGSDGGGEAYAFDMR